MSPVKSVTYLSERTVDNELSIRMLEKAECKRMLQIGDRRVQNAESDA